MELYSRNPQIIDGELDNNQIMMHIEQGKYFGLNLVGKRIWQIIEKPTSFEQIINKLTNEFNINKEICEKEVKDFLDKSVAFKIVDKHEAN